MSYPVEKYKISTELKRDFVRNIKFLFFFADYESSLSANRNDILIMTKDDKVYAIGDNYMGRLGLGHNYGLVSPEMISELSNKGIVDFANGLYHVIARTRKGEIYTWGNNEFGQLGNGTRDTKFYRPALNEKLIEECIVDMCCGSYHSLVLTKTGTVYGWGCSDWGQTGNGCDNRHQLVPTVIYGFGGERVLQISCGFSHSMAITETGCVFKWGFTIDKSYGYSQIKDCTTAINIFKSDYIKRFSRYLPKPIRFKDDQLAVQKISCGRLHSLILSCDGDIYAFGCNRFGQLGGGKKKYRKCPLKLNLENKFIDIASHFSCDFSVALSVDHVFYVWGKCGDQVITIPTETEFKSFHEVFAHYFLLDYEYKTKVVENETEENLSSETVSTAFRSQISNSASTLLSRQLINKFEEYEIMDKLRGEFIQNIKIVIIFYNNVIIASKDNNVYSMGNNAIGCLGLGHDNTVEEPTIIDELVDKPIISFMNGLNHFVALTSGRELYLWGSNEFGQLGNGSCNTDCNKPKMNENLINKCIVDVCCGDYHTLALTNTGLVYSWGDNRRGQIGNGSRNDIQSTPTELFGFDRRKIKAISCGARHSVALSESGRVFSWGYNFFGQLGTGNNVNSYSPRLVKIKNNNKNVIIKKVSCGQCYTLLLSSDGDIYAFGCNNWGQLGIDSEKNHYIPIKLENENKFIDIASHFRSDVSAALSEAGIYYVWGKCNEAITKPIETSFTSFNEIFGHFLQITHKPILTFDESLIVIDSLQNGKYKEEFDEFSMISYGSYGVVYRARNKNDGEFCAIKKIGLNNNYIDPVIKELRIMSKLKSECVVQLKSSWIEINYMKNNNTTAHCLNLSHKIFDRNSTLILHMQMELCRSTLKQVTKEILERLNLKKFEHLPPIGYYVASSLFREILESVNYLHKQNPPIIHRDLKPTNILISNGVNGRFVKIGDFGLATVHEFDNQTHSHRLGTGRYMAPEVYVNQKYDTKADVYSLGVMLEELFNFEEENIRNLYANPILMIKYMNISKLKKKMTKFNTKIRPDCGTILKEKKLWSLRMKDVENENGLEEIRERLQNNEKFDDDFFLLFMHKKLKL